MYDSWHAVKQIGSRAPSYPARHTDVLAGCHGCLRIVLNCSLRHLALGHMFSESPWEASTQSYVNSIWMWVKRYPLWPPISLDIVNPRLSIGLPLLRAEKTLFSFLYFRNLNTPVRHAHLPLHFVLGPSHFGPGLAQWNCCDDPRAIGCRGFWSYQSAKVTPSRHVFPR